MKSAKRHGAIRKTVMPAQVTKAEYEKLSSEGKYEIEMFVCITETANEKNIFSLMDISRRLRK